MHNAHPLAWNRSVKPSRRPWSPEFVQMIDSYTNDFLIAGKIRTSNGGWHFDCARVCRMYTSLSTAPRHAPTVMSGAAAMLR
ncbi:MAG: hypothetical protein QE272_13095 [Nevskia sp.]|jgi:hypothetical protein|nr:hypothetical protein [Gammaproteobacteria bacterium]MDH4459627.1 hypothetical protein [Nevskia sp.]